MSRLHDRIDLVIGDLTRLDVDAVVNAANEALLGGGGVDGAVHRAAGPALVEVCRALPETAPGVRCPVGHARITPGFDLAARFVIHTVGPRWEGGAAGEADALSQAYWNSLLVAAGHRLGTVAFPAISTGVFGYPAGQAARVAVRTIRGFLEWHDRPARVLLVALDEAAAAPLRDELAR